MSVLDNGSGGKAWYLVPTKEKIFNKLMANTVIAELSDKNPKSNWKEVKLYT